MALIIPENYDPHLTVRETQEAIKYIRDTFQKEFGREMNLERISAPLFVEKSSGLNDNLNGVERPVQFDIAGIPGETVEVVHSLAKWKRMALHEYGFLPGEGLYTNMNAIRRDEDLDNLHSCYVDQWDWEKIITREDRNPEYLKNTVNQIIAIREAMNLMSLLKDPEKRREAELLAAAITGASGIAPLVSVTTFFILTVWALAESVEDVKALLEGGKVPFLKQGREWRVSLTGLAESGTALFRELGASGNEGEGLDYQSYLKLLFWLSGLPKKEYRMMDMIQKNIRTGQPSFLMRKCAYRLEAEYKGRGTVIPISKKAVKAY